MRKKILIIGVLFTLGVVFASTHAWCGSVSACGSSMYACDGGLRGDERLDFILELCYSMCD